jgi:hypothetical protein
LKLGEPLIDHPPTQTSNHLTSQYDVGVKLLTSQIQEPIPKSDLFRVLRVTSYWQRQLRSLRHKLDFLRADFDLTGRKIRIDLIRFPGKHFAVDSDHRLQLDSLDQRKGRTVLVDNDLCQPVMISQVDKQEIPVIPNTKNPTGEANGVANVG